MSIPLFVSHLSLRLSISDSLSLLLVLTHSLSSDSKLHNHHTMAWPTITGHGKPPPTHYFSSLSLVADQCGGVESSIWGLVQRSVFGCGVEIGVGLWVCCGFCLGLPWVAWVWIGVGLWVCCGFCWWSERVVLMVWFFLFFYFLWCWW